MADTTDIPPPEEAAAMTESSSSSDSKKKENDEGSGGKKKDGDDTNNNNDSTKAKKKRTVTRPIPPPSVTTAQLLLRGVVAGVTGASLVDIDASPLQPTFVKDGKSTGKFIINLGKKTGTSCTLDIPEDSMGQGLVLDAIENAANRIIDENLPIEVVSSLTLDDAVEKYAGGGTKFFFFDAVQKKKPPKGDVTLVHIPGVVLAANPTSTDPVLSTTGQLGKIQLDRNNLGCSIMSGKKSKKCDISLKFLVLEEEGKEEKPNAEDAGGAGNIDVDRVQTLLVKSIRMLEGEELLQKQQGAAAAGGDDDANKQKKEGGKSSEQPPTTKQDEGGRQEEQGSTPNDNDKEDGEEDENEMIVNAWEVKGKIDYTKLVEQFGSKMIHPQEHLERLRQLTVERNGTVPDLHRFLRRNIFFSHRDFDRILDCHERGQPLYLYTGRGPSSGAMHLGHLVPFLMTLWLQQAFGCPLVIQMTDDEKFLFKGEYTDADGDNLEYYQRLTMENAKDIIACGFDKSKTFLFSDLDYVGTMYPNIVRIWKAVTVNTVNGVFGFNASSNIGKIAFPAIQAAPSFPSSFPKVLDATRDSDMACLIPCAIDQDPYFRVTRDVAHKLVKKTHPLGGKPALVHSKFFPPLQGAEGKMSSSDANSAIFLTDTPEEIERKIKEYAFSGGRETKKEQQELGANLDVDVSYQWLRFFLEDDDELEKIGREYGSGTGEYWSTGKVKARLVEVLKRIVAGHQERRAGITDEMVREWMEQRCIL